MQVNWYKVDAKIFQLKEDGFTTFLVPLMALVRYSLSAWTSRGGSGASNRDGW